jgi:hypothetical protein
VGSLPQFEEYGGPLLRGHLSAVKGIGGIGLLKGIEDADYFLHNLILPWLFYFGGGGFPPEAWMGRCAGGLPISWAGSA